MTLLVSSIVNNCLCILCYRPQQSCGKVMFLHVCVILFTGGCLLPGGVCSMGCLLGGCLLPREGGVCSMGVCLLLEGLLLGGVCSWGSSAPGGVSARGVSALGGVSAPGGVCSRGCVCCQDTGVSQISVRIQHS